MSEDEFRADLRWPTDPLGERPPAHLADPDATVWERPDVDVDADDRTLADAVDRLSDRLAERLRALRAALDGDLADLRTELAAVGQVVRELADRPPPAPGPPAAAPAPDLRPLRDEIGALRASVDAIAGAVTSDRLDDLADELSGVQAELVALRRRISLRASGAEAPALTDEQLDRVAAAVADRLQADGRRGRG